MHVTTTINSLTFRPCCAMIMGMDEKKKEREKKEGRLTGYRAKPVCCIPWVVNNAR